MYTFVIFCSCIFLIVGSMIKDHYKMKKLALDRGDSDICAYAKSFDYRSVDTKVMREVWNEVQLWLGKFDGKSFPVKAEDSFELYVGS